jgi:hypothetical protein
MLAPPRTWPGACRRLAPPPLQALLMPLPLLLPELCLSFFCLPPERPIPAHAGARQHQSACHLCCCRKAGLCCPEAAARGLLLLLLLLLLLVEGCRVPALTLLHRALHLQEEVARRGLCKDQGGVWQAGRAGRQAGAGGRQQAPLHPAKPTGQQAAHAKQAAVQPGSSLPAGQA